MKTLLISFLFFTLSAGVFAGEPKLVVVATDQGGYPAKALCFFSNNYLVTHPQGLLVQYTCLGGPDINSEIWLVNEKPVQIGVSQFGNLFTEPFVRGNTIYFMEFNEFETVALWKYENGTLSSQELPKSLKDSHVHDFALLGDTFYFRYTNHETQVHGEGMFKDEFVILPARGPEFFWKASFNGEIMLQKTKLAVGEAVELRTKDSTAPAVILRDKNADATSPFLNLRNQFAIRGKKWATFARTSNGTVLIRGEGSDFSVEDISSQFKDIQFWPPALSTDGEIIFRGTDISGVFALWGIKNGVKRMVLGSGQEIREESETVVTSSRSLMYNSPVIDQEGHLYIGVGLRAPESNSDFGQGIIKF